MNSFCFNQINYSITDVVGYFDYLPFGQVMPNRHRDDNQYRYGFNGMEKDDELKGNSNSYDFGARIYDPRLGRWLSRDPHEGKYPNQSGYNYSFNSPLLFNDPNGKDAVITITKQGDKTIVTYTTKIYLMGSGVDKEYLSHIEHYSQQAFQTRDITIDGKSYQLVLDVQFVNAETKDLAEQSKLPSSIKDYKARNYDNGESIPTKEEQLKKGANPKENSLEFGDNVILTGRSDIDNGEGKGNAAYAGSIECQAWIGTFPANATNSIVSSAQKAAYATIHESFHLLGLSDRNNDPNYLADWMGPYTNAKADLLVTLSPQHTQNLVKIALSLNPKNDPYKNTVNSGKKNKCVTIYKNQSSTVNADKAVDSTIP
jgi:RHS repeat-associated protein